MDLCDIGQIKALLARHGFRFSKSMGQNFLIADWVPREIAKASGAGPGSGVLEVGPGIGCLTRELAPFILDWTKRPGILAFGCSLGATHAANLFFRRPDLFDRVLALSGIYTGSYGFGGYSDELVYLNSLVDCMANMPSGHPYIDLYNRKKGVVCAGQGAWEQPETTRRLKQIFEEKGINIWVDLWGWDVCHDWPWWYKQTEYFLPYLLD